MTKEEFEATCRLQVNILSQIGTILADNEMSLIIAENEICLCTDDIGYTEYTL